MPDIGGVSDAFGVRELVRLVMLSGLSTVVCLLAYPRNAPTRRLLVLCAVAVLAALPWLLLGQPLVVELPMTTPWEWSNAVPVWLLVVWAGVAAALMARTALRAFRCQKRLLAAEPHADSDVVGSAAQLARELGVDIAVRTGTADVPGPSSGTLLQPLLVLPADAGGWPPSTLRAVVCHELVHVRRRDDLWMLAARLLADLYWWMPWLHLLRATLEQAVEESCDDYASEHFGGTLGYVDGLVDGAGRCVLGVAPSALTHLGRHPLVGRVQRFGAARGMELDSRGAYWALVGILAVVLCLTSLKPVALSIDVSTEGGAPMRLVHADGQASGVQPAPVFLPSVHSHLTFSGGQRAEALSPQSLPIYPGVALLAGTEGRVALRFELGRDGKAYRISVQSADVGEPFLTAAIEALKATTYRTASQSPTLATRPQQEPLILTQTYLFRLQRL
jgi:hypothetical protein